MFLTITINPSHAALSAQTVKVIQGSAPYLVLADGTKLKNLNHLLGFSMPKRDGSKGREQIDSTSTELVISKTMKFSDIEATGYTVYHQHDDDGDVAIHSQAISITWLNNRNETIRDLNQVLSFCDAPYRLTISVNHLQARTTYGVPNVTDYGSATKTYTFTLAVNDETGKSNHKITHIQPQSMQVYTRNTLYPQGYNPAVWDEDKGFSVSKMKVAGKHFPTTGFDKAVFDVIGTGNDQTRYCVKAPANSWVKVSGRRVTYQHDSKQSKPQTPVKLDMYYRDDNNSWSRVDSYTIPVPSKWAISPVGESYYSSYSNAPLHQVAYFYALDKCRKVGPRADNKETSIPEGRGQTVENRAVRQQFMYRRDELSNGEAADRTKYPEGNLGTGNSNSNNYNYYARDIGTFMGEWGYVKNYAHSPWSSHNWYWSAEVGNWYAQIYVVSNGGVHWYYRPDHYGAAYICRGE